MLGAALLIYAQKAFKRKSAGRQPRQRHGCGKCGGAGDGYNIYSRCNADVNKVLTGVGNCRHTCVRDKSTAFSAENTRKNYFAALTAVVLKIADERLFYVKSV